jgi:hypothetical protein
VSRPPPASREEKGDVAGPVRIIKGNPDRYRVPYFRKSEPTGSDDRSGNLDHLILIFPVYLKLMMGFPSFYTEVGVAEFAN